VHTYYSPESRKKKYDLKAYDVVITTYAVLAMDFADKFEPEENNNSNDNNN
jgi:hypothetical protein